MINLIDAITMYLLFLLTFMGVGVIILHIISLGQNMVEVLENND